MYTKDCLTYCKLLYFFWFSINSKIFQITLLYRIFTLSTIFLSLFWIDSTMQSVLKGEVINLLYYPYFFFYIFYISCCVIKSLLKRIFYMRYFIYILGNFVYRDQMHTTPKCNRSEIHYPIQEVKLLCPTLWP